MVAVFLKKSVSSVAWNTRKQSTVLLCTELKKTNVTFRAAGSTRVMRHRLHQ